MARCILGYEIIGGCGLGLGYVSPVSTLVRWFPDRRGMATGMAIMGFGGGAIIGACQQQEYLLKCHFISAHPTSVPGKGSLRVRPSTNEAGVQFATVAGSLREIIVVSAKEAAGRADHAVAGLYLSGTGSSGVAETFVALGIIYGIVMLAAALTYRIPAPAWKPGGWTHPDARRSAIMMISLRNVALGEALKTPQFYLLWIMLCFNVTAGIGILGVAKTMITDIFGDTLREHALDVSSFAATYVLMTGAFNMLGRFFWASASDYLGRKTTYTIFFVAGAGSYLSMSSGRPTRKSFSTKSSGSSCSTPPRC